MLVYKRKIEGEMVRSEIESTTEHFHDGIIKALSVVHSDDPLCKVRINSHSYMFGARFPVMSPLSFDISF